jgi:hypothetical protein
MKSNEATWKALKGGNRIDSKVMFLNDMDQVNATTKTRKDNYRPPYNRVTRQPIASTSRSHKEDYAHSHKHLQAAKKKRITCDLLQASTYNQHRPQTIDQLIQGEKTPKLQASSWKELTNLLSQSSNWLPLPVT